MQVIRTSSGSPARCTEPAKFKSKMMPGTWEAVSEREWKEFYRNPGAGRALPEPGMGFGACLLLGFGIWDLDLGFRNTSCLQWKLHHLTGEVS